MRRPAEITRFALKVLAWFIFWTVVWYEARYLLILPTHLLSGLVATYLLPAWAEAVVQHGTILTLNTSLQVQHIAGAKPGQIALLTPAVNSMLYAYGWPLLMALITASTRRWLIAKMLMATLMLLPFEVAGITFDWVKQVGIEAGALELNPLQANLIAVGYQMFYLIFPALAPVLIWLAMERRFVATLTRLPDTDTSGDNQQKPSNEPLPADCARQNETNT